MPTFQELPSEIRDLIYRYSLLTDQTLVAVNEQLDTTPPTLTETDSATPLLAVSKAINAEVAPIFYGQNKFKLSLCLPNTADNRQTIFQKYPTLFRNIICYFVIEDLPSVAKYATWQLFVDSAMEIWQATIHSLAAMTNLKLLVMDVDGLRLLAHPWRSRNVPGGPFQAVALHFKPLLLRSIPSGLKQRGAKSTDEGIWITGDFIRGYPLSVLLEVWEELGAQYLDRQRERVIGDFAGTLNHLRGY